MLNFWSASNWIFRFHLYVRRRKATPGVPDKEVPCCAGGIGNLGQNHKTPTGPSHDVRLIIGTFLILIPTGTCLIPIGTYLKITQSEPNLRFFLGFKIQKC